MPQPVYIVFAGVNGAGKSTLFRSGLWTKDPAELDLPRVNSDEILVSHGWDWADSGAQLKAGKEAVGLIRKHLSEGSSFNQETTMTGHSIVRNIKRAKELGYCVKLYYVGVENMQIAIDRIKHRVEVGGHDIDPAAVARRYESSLENLKKIAGLCDAIRVFDNTQKMRLVAASCEKGLAEFRYGAQRLSWYGEILDVLGALSEAKKQSGDATYN